MATLEARIANASDADLREILLGLGTNPYCGPMVRQFLDVVDWRNRQLEVEHIRLCWRCLRPFVDECSGQQACCYHPGRQVCQEDGEAGYQNPASCVWDCCDGDGTAPGCVEAAHKPVPKSCPAPTSHGESETRRRQEPQLAAGHEASRAPGSHPEPSMSHGPGMLDSGVRQLQRAEELGTGPSTAGQVFAWPWGHINTQNGNVSTRAEATNECVQVIASWPWGCQSQADKKP